MSNISKLDGMKVKNTQVTSVPLKTFVAKYPEGLDYTYNVRFPVNETVISSIKKTLHTSPESFEARNKGIVIVNDKYVIDGGHTTKSILEAFKEGADYSNGGRVTVKYLFLEQKDLKGLTPHLADDLNSGKTPKKSELMNARGAFDVIKDVLGSYSKNFEFKPEIKETNKHQASLTLAMLNAIVGNSPVISYTKNGLIGNHERHPHRMNDLVHMLPTCVDLWCDIYRFIESTKPGRRKGHGVNPLTSKSFVLPDGTFSNYEISEAFIWPIFYAFSAAYEIVEGDLTKFRSLIPELMFYKSGNKRNELTVLETLWDNVTSCKSNKDSIVSVGRNEALYEKNKAIVSNAYYKMETVKLKKLVEKTLQ